MTNQTDPAALVKALVWEYHPAGTIAAPPTGHAYIADTRTKGRCRSIKGFNPQRDFESLEAFKKAAQADYEARILSALNVIDAKALVKAALEMGARMVDCACENKTKVAALPVKNSGERWRLCGAEPCGAIEAAAIRALADDPEAVAEIVEQAKGESDE